MEKLNFYDIKEILESDIFNDFEFGPREWFDDNVEYESDYLSNKENYQEFYDLFKRLGKFEVKQQHGGEGEGDKYWIVYHFIDHDIYIKFYGWYASYHGAEYQDMYEVKPVEVTVIEYQEVKN